MLPATLAFYGQDLVPIRVPIDTTACSAASNFVFAISGLQHLPGTGVVRLLLLNGGDKPLLLGSYAIDEDSLQITTFQMFVSVDPQVADRLLQPGEATLALVFFQGATATPVSARSISMLKCY